MMGWLVNGMLIVLGVVLILSVLVVLFFLWFLAMGEVLAFIADQWESAKNRRRYGRPKTGT